MYWLKLKLLAIPSLNASVYLHMQIRTFKAHEPPGSYARHRPFSLVHHTASSQSHSPHIRFIHRTFFVLPSLALANFFFTFLIPRSLSLFLYFFDSLVFRVRVNGRRSLLVASRSGSLIARWVSRCEADARTRSRQKEERQLITYILARVPVSASTFVSTQITDEHSTPSPLTIGRNWFLALCSCLCNSLSLPFTHLALTLFTLEARDQSRITYNRRQLIITCCLMPQRDVYVWLRQNSKFTLSFIMNEQQHLSRFTFFLIKIHFIKSSFLSGFFFN